MTCLFVICLVCHLSVSVLIIPNCGIQGQPGFFSETLSQTPTQEKKKSSGPYFKIKRKVLSLFFPIFLLKQLRKSCLRQCGTNQYSCKLLDVKLLECLLLTLESYLLISLTVGLFQGERWLGPYGWISNVTFPPVGHQGPRVSHPPYIWPF